MHLLLIQVSAAYMLQSSSTNCKRYKQQVWRTSDSLNDCKHQRSRSNSRLQPTPTIVSTQNSHWHELGTHCVWSWSPPTSHPSLVQSIVYRSPVQVKLWLLQPGGWDTEGWTTWWILTASLTEVILKRQWAANVLIVIYLQLLQVVTWWIVITDLYSQPCHATSDCLGEETSPLYLIPPTSPYC